MAVQRVIAALVERTRGVLTFRLKPHSLVALAGVDEFGRQHARGAQRFAIGFQRFIDHVKAVTLAQCAAKIDIARENFGDLHAHAIGDAGLVGRSKKRSLDAAAGQSGRARVGRGFNA